MDIGGLELANIHTFGDREAPTATQLPKSTVERLLADARMRLVEIGTRNRLVHTPRGAKRSRALSVIETDTDGLFDALAISGRAMRFVPAVAATVPTLAAPHGSVNRLPRGGGASAQLQANLDVEAMAKRLLAIYRDARTAEEEQGINILFLAIGFLRWYEDDKSEVVREAPLVLVPVSLIRDPRHSTFDLRVRDEDIATNQAVQERLRTDFGVILPDLPDGEEWRPSHYFAMVRDAIQGKPRWSIVPDAIELGFYSFSKLLMIRDLDPEVWGNKSILQHPLLRGLLAEGFKEEPAVIPADAALDKLFAPADLIQVVDADSSQTIVIETVRAGRNLVVQGPPGTGKSQTITNIIAAAVHDGKTVLFVAEKMAALDVVHARLRRVGLGSTCLELHSRGANKKQVLAELEDTLNQSAVEPDSQAETRRLTDIRDTLNAVASRMHATIGDTDVTPFQALSRLVSGAERGIASFPPLLAEARNWSAGEYASVVEATTRLVEITSSAGPSVHHPFFGVQATQLQPAELQRLAGPLTSSRGRRGGARRLGGDYRSIPGYRAGSLAESL